MNSNELYHYGVLGMKWGVRRARRAVQKYLFYLDTCSMQIYEPVTFRGLIRYIIKKMR